MAQTWVDLLFMHWQVSIDSLRPLIPSFLEIDTFDSMAWIGVVPFGMTNIHFRFLPPVPFLSTFLELNVRTYVKWKGKSGVYFFSLDASHPIAVETARKFFCLPYYNAIMSKNPQAGGISYSSRRTDNRSNKAILEVDYKPIGDIYFSQPESLESWLTERYCFLASNREGKPILCEIHHQQWPLQKASAKIHKNSMTQAIGIELPQSDPLIHFVRSLDTIEWSLENLK